jgi:hypothetical protein
MKIIFVNWTKPFYYKNQFNGYKKSSTSFNDNTEYCLEDYEILMQLTTISCAKKNSNLPLKLYTDNIGYEYYKKIGLIKYFDEVNTELLNSINESDIINAGQFWTSGKIISICNEEPPFIFMDLDLFLLSKIPNWIYENDLVCTHWELPRHFLYITKNMLDERQLSIPEFDETMLIPNTSFLYINNNEIQKRYLELHYEIVNKKYESVPDWLWLMSDQNILGYVARNMKIKASQIDNKVYLQFPDSDQKQGLVGFTPKWTHFDNIAINKPNLEYNHIWLEKSRLVLDKNYREENMKKWTNMIIANGHINFINKPKFL